MYRVEGKIISEIASYFAPPIKQLLLGLDEHYFNRLEEIRLRCQQPLLLKSGDRDITITSSGRPAEDLNSGYVVTREDIQRSLASISDNSLYAFEEEIKRGFITIPGGHRVGLAGQAVINGGQIKTIKNFSSLCFRIARQVPDCALPLIPYIAPRGVPVSSLLISPPRCGKTTLLRDLARILSTGRPNLPARNVAVIDERSELAGCYLGIPQLDVGTRTDVLDACPKAEGMMMAIRSLSPQVVITDEIGRAEDVTAIRECLNAGVAVIASVHARNVKELENRPLMQDLMKLKAFQSGITLSRRIHPGNIEEIVRWQA
ncbi:MAG: stage III sporulation protein AA [Syntrophomonadaceae bacterium]